MVAVVRQRTRDETAEQPASPQASDQQTNGNTASKDATATTKTATTTTTKTSNGSSWLPQFRTKLIWWNIFWTFMLHLTLPVGAYMTYKGQVHPLTLVWTFVGVYAAMVGIAGGAHRLWSHRAYKARWPVQLIMMLLQTLAGQNTIYRWARDHRVHHKFVETDADPHNILRGFFFAHMGWLLCEEHPEVTAKKKTIDMSDLEANPIVMFQHRNRWPITMLVTILLPVAIPVYLWNESLFVSYVLSFGVRYTLSLHGIWLVNSIAHSHGAQTYDKNQEARDSPLLIALSYGPGWHNYHHTFPWDYSSSEYGWAYNLTTAIIDTFAAIGWVYDRRKASPEMVAERKRRTGEHWELTY